MKIAVTSASGALGSTVVKQLLKTESRSSVVALARTPEKAKDLGVEVRKADYSDEGQFRKALQDIDAVLLISGNDKPQNRIGQHRNVIKAALANGVKKIVYTSIFGADKGNAFSPIVASNRQTEEDIRNSGMSFAIGRNGIYIEPDLEYLDFYKKEGKISNCAGEGKCGYTSRQELATAYARLLLDDSFDGGTYNLLGTAITQQQLVDGINDAYKLNLVFRDVSVEQYLAERKAALGEFLGTVIGGIYEGMRAGKFAGPSDFEKIVGRSHKSLQEMIADFEGEK